VSDRPYRSGFSNQEALNIIEQGEGTQMSPTFIELLRAHVNIYPVGTVVILTTGDTALVMGENTADPHRPRVKLLFDRNQKANTNDYTLDLANYETVSIRKIIAAEAATFIISRYLATRSPQTSTG